MIRVHTENIKVDGIGAKPPPKNFTQQQLGRWEVVPDDNHQDIHVYPAWGRNHDLRHGIDCWCKPFRDHVMPTVIVHFDLTC